MEEVVAMESTAKDAVPLGSSRDPRNRTMNEFFPTTSRRTSSAGSTRTLVGNDVATKTLIKEMNDMVKEIRLDTEPQLQTGPPTGKRNITNPTPSKDKRYRDDPMDDRTVAESVIEDHGVNILDDGSRLDDFEMEVEADKNFEQDKPTYAQKAATGTGNKMDYPHLIIVYGWSGNIPCDLSEHIFTTWMDTLNDLIKEHVKSKSPPKLDCDGRSFSLSKGMFFPNNMQSMMWLEAQIQKLETEGITPRIVKPNVWKISATAYPYQLRFFYEVGYCLLYTSPSPRDRG